MFFPFDPYLLKRSSGYLVLKESYVRWRHGHPSQRHQAVAGAGGGLHGGSEEEEEDDESEEVGWGPHVGIVLGGFEGLSSTVY